MAKSEGHSTSILIMTWGYWLELIIISFASVFSNEAWIGMIVFPCVFILVTVPIAFYFSKLEAKQFYDEVLMCGVRKIGYAFSKLGREDYSVEEWWEVWFNIYWGFLTKFINPAILFFITCSILKTDIEKPYGKFSTKWQVCRRRQLSKVVVP